MITIDNVLDISRNNPTDIVQAVAEIIDSPEYAIPTEVTGKAGVRETLRLSAYYAGIYPYLINLWGVVRIHAGRDAQLIAVRDYLEKAASAAKLKWQAASRGLTGFQTLQEEEEMHGRQI
jgi:hypothetical protein